MSRSASEFTHGTRSPDLASESGDFTLEELEQAYDVFSPEDDSDGESVDGPDSMDPNDPGLQPPNISLDEEPPLALSDYAMDQMFPSADNTTPLTFGLRRSRAKYGRLKLTADTVAEGGDLQRFKTKYAAYLTGTPLSQTIQNRLARQAKGATTSPRGKRAGRAARSPARSRLDTIETRPDIQMRVTTRGKRKYYPIVRADAFIKKGQDLGSLEGPLVTLEMAEDLYAEGADATRMVEVKKAGDPQTYVINGTDVLHWAWFMQDATEHNVVPNVRMTRGGYLKAAMDIPANTPLYIEWSKSLVMMEDDAPDEQSLMDGEDDAAEGETESDDQEDEDRRDETENNKENENYGGVEGADNRVEDYGGYGESTNIQYQASNSGYSVNDDDDAASSELRPSDVIPLSDMNDQLFLSDLPQGENDSVFNVPDSSDSEQEPFSPEW